MTFWVKFRVEFRVPTSLMTGEMATLCLFDMDGTLTAPRQVGSAPETRGGGAEPLLPQTAVTTVRKPGDASPERGPAWGAQEEGAKKTFRVGNVFRVRTGLNFF